MQIILEGPVVLEHLDTEDSGMALIYHLDSDLEGHQESGLFVRIQSWDETKDHTQMTQLLKAATGKRIRVTIDVV